MTLYEAKEFFKKNNSNIGLIEKDNANIKQYKDFMKIKISKTLLNEWHNANMSDLNKILSKEYDDLVYHNFIKSLIPNNFDDAVLLLLIISRDITSFSIDSLKQTFNKLIGNVYSKKINGFIYWAIKNKNIELAKNLADACSEIKKNLEQQHIYLTKELEAYSILLKKYKLANQDIINNYYSEAKYNEFNYYKEILNGCWINNIDTYKDIYEYSKMLYYGIGCEKNKQEAIKTLKLLCSFKYRKAILFLLIHRK